MTDKTYIMPDNLRTVLHIAKVLYSTHGAVWFDSWAFTDMTTMSWKEINYCVDELVLHGFLDWRGKGVTDFNSGTRISQVGLDYLEGVKS